MNIKTLTSDSPSNSFIWIEFQDFETICFNLACKHLDFGEPIPEFNTRNPGILESCIDQPLQKFSGVELYKSFEEKLAIFFYLMIKNHPFQNGNKRIALTSLMIILLINNLWLKSDSKQVYKLAKRIASSDSADKKRELVYIEKFLKTKIVRIKIPE